MEIRLKPLRKMVKKFYRKSIPALAWSAKLASLFTDLKKSRTSSPVLAQFDPLKLIVLKTDWSSEGMGWILMQPVDDEKSTRAATTLKETGKCLFDLTKNGARLKPVAFGLQGCNTNEVNFHSFTGEGAYGRWAIIQNRKYLRGCHFYWMCDCSSIKYILEYDKSIPMICQWAQELLGYQFSVIYCHNQIMVNINALTRRFGKLIATHCCIAHGLSKRDKKLRPDAYKKSTFYLSATAKLEKPSEPYKYPPILYNYSVMDIVKGTCIAEVHTQLTIISSCPVLFVVPFKETIISENPNDIKMKITAVAGTLFSEWWCIGNYFGSLLNWSTTQPSESS